MVNKLWLIFLPAIFFLAFQDDKLAASIARGALIYEDFCVECHMADGKGVPDSYPPLAESDYLFEHTDAAIKGVKYGQDGEIEVNGIIYNNIMAPLYLSDEEVMDVMNYILNSWGNEGDFITLERVQSIVDE